MVERQLSGRTDAGESNPWALAQQRLRSILDEHSYKNWFSQTVFGGYVEGELVVRVPRQFIADWLRDHYMDAIHDCVRDWAPDLRVVRFEVAPEKTEGHTNGKRPKPEMKGISSRQQALPIGLNPRYTFDRFVVGAGNRFAHAAAKAVSETPARAYNPLFLYGETGLGKTHLMQAIGHELIERKSNANVLFISSETFTNELIDSIARKSTSRFRSMYRRADVLLIDDIHFIAGKEATQEEFFHTFNELFDRHRQIVISSDRQPKEIQGLEDRLISRFEWGLVTDIQAPDLETRIAILQSKAAEERLTVPAEVLKYIATFVTSNIRELEGALITLIAYSRLTDEPVTLKVAEDVLHDLIGRDKIRPTTIEGVQRAVAEHFDVRISDLRGRSRQRQVAFPRQVAMYLCKELIPSLSLNEVGEAFGGKDHTTVLYACRKLAEEDRSNPSIRQLVKDLTRTIRGDA